MERLQKLIAARGLCSRRRAEELILAGRVSLNGAAASLGDKADPDKDEIRVDGRSLPPLGETRCLMLNKPRGYITTMADERGRKTAAQLVKDCGCRVVPIGRLDMDSEGLLLFTNDGELLNRILHPKHQVEKCYRVRVRGYAPQKLELLKKPISLDGREIAPPQVRLLEADGENARLEIVIHEGRNRQIRRMCEKVSMEVLRLKRIREGRLPLGDLPTGAWRWLTEEEIDLLINES